MSAKKDGTVALAAGHCSASIGEVAGEAVSQSGPTGDFVYLDIGSVDRELKIFVEPKRLALNEAPSRAKQVVHVGDVLVSMTRPNLNAVAMVPDGNDEMIASTGFLVLRSCWAESKFLYYLVQTDDFIDAMSAVVQGALYPAVRPRDISGYQFNLPPRAEQIRIVEKLEELLSELDAGVAELKAAQRKLAAFRQSLLNAAVEGTLTADWRAARANDHAPQETGADLLQRILAERRARWEQKQLARFAAQGKTPPSGWQLKYPESIRPDIVALPVVPQSWTWASLSQAVADSLIGLDRGQGHQSSVSGNVGYVKMNNISMTGEVETSALVRVDCSIEEADRYALAIGDVLFNTRNSKELVGKVGLVRQLHGATVYNNNLMRLRFHGFIEPAFACFQMCAPDFRARMNKVKKATTSVAAVYAKDLFPLPIVIPPKEEQAVICARVDAQLAALEEQASAIHSALKQAAAQRRNILKAAFAGQLVPQDPADEPASVLLERIRAARAAQGPTTRKRGRKARESA